MNLHPTLPGSASRGVTLRRMVLTGAVVGAVAVAGAGGYLYYRANSAGQLAARAQLALDQHDPTKAMEYLQRALARHGSGETGAGLRNLMARALLEAGREADARSYLQQSLADRPDNADALDLVAQSYVNPALRKLRDAFKPITAASADEIYATIADGLKQLDAAPATPRNLVAAGQLHRLKFLVLQDQQHQVEGQLDAARIAQDQQSMTAANRRLEALAAPLAAESAATLEKLRAALKLDPKNTTAAGAIAQYEYQDRHLPEAMAVYEQMQKNGAMSEDIVLAAARATLDDAGRQPDHQARMTAAQRMLEEFLKDHPRSARVMVSLGDVLLEQDQVQAAEKLGEKAAAEAPGDLASQILLINCKLRQKKSGEALALITPLTTSHAAQAEVWYLLGVAQTDAGDENSAENSFRKALAVNPAYTDARQALLLHELKGGNSSSAALIASDLLRDDRYNMLAWQVTLDGMRKLGQADRARALLVALSQDRNLPQESRPELVRLLALYDAPADAQRVLASMPIGDKSTLALRAYVAAAAGNSVESRTLIGQALEASPGDVDLRLKYADLLRQAGLPADERAQLERLSKGPLSADQSLQVARAYLHLRMPAEAQASLKPVLDKQPQNAGALALRRQAEAMLGGQAGAGTPVIASLQNASLSDLAQVAAADVKQKKYKEALETARAGLARDKSNLPLHQSAALALAGLGQYDQAVEEAVDAARIQPDAVPAYSTFVEMFASPDAAMKGIGYGSRLESVNPALGNWAMGRLALSAGEYDLALRYYRKGLDATARLVNSRDAKDALYQSILTLHGQTRNSESLRKDADALAAADATFAPGIHIMACDQLLSLGDRQGAQQQLEAVAGSLKQDSRVPLVLAIATRWLALGQGDRARAVMEKQVAANGQQPELLDAYASLLRQMGDADKALEVRGALCKLDAGNPLYRISYAQAQADAGDLPGAFRTLDETHAMGQTGAETATAAKMRLLIGMGLLDEAGQELKAAARDDSASRLAVAQAWADLGKPEEARAMAQPIPAYAAEYPAARILLAGLDLDAGKAEAAATALRTIISQYPQAAEQAAPQLFIASLRAGDAKGALDLATQQRSAFLANTPPWANWTALAATAAREGGQYDQAAALLGGLDAAGRQRASLDLALLALLQNKPDEARTLAAQIPNSTPDYTQATLQMLAGAPAPAGSAVFADGLNSSVLAALGAAPEKLKSLPPELAGNQRVFQGDYACLAREMGQATDAGAVLHKLALAQRLLEAGWSTATLRVLDDLEKGPGAPKLTMAAIMRHQALTQLHRFEQADAIRDQLAQATRRDDPAAAPSARILLAAAWSSQEKYADALAMLEPLAALKRPDVLTTLATLHEKMGQLDRAIALHREVRRIDPQNVMAANNLAYTLAAAHPNDKAALDEARQAITFAIEHAPQVQAFQDTRGWIEILSGNPTGGTRIIARVLPALRLDPAVHYHLGVGYSRIGQTALARLHLQNVAHLAGDRQGIPERPLAVEALQALASRQ